MRLRGSTLVMNASTAETIAPPRKCEGAGFPTKPDPLAQKLLRRLRVDPRPKRSWRGATLSIVGSLDEQPRYLRRTLGAGPDYVHDPALSVLDEPECVDAKTQREITRRASRARREQLRHEWLAIVGEIDSFANRALPLPVRRDANAVARAARRVDRAISAL
jgi:hypothetical protein